MKNESLKEVGREMCSATNGGREVMAGALGMSATSFNNRFYEKNGCRFFDHHDLMTMQEVSGTKLYAEYVATESEMLLVERINPDDLDEPELFRLHSKVAANQGALAVFMDKSLEDGQVDSEEEKQLKKLLDRTVATGRTFIYAFIKYHKKG